MSSDVADRRALLCDQIAAIVLADGLAAFALRGLAARLSTSGRMLLYYFGSKDCLVRDVLQRISVRLRERLAIRPETPPAPPGQLVAALLDLAAQADVAPFMRVWTEMVAAGARGEAPFDTVAPAMVAEWVAMIEARLLPAWQRDGTATAILAMMEGLTLLELASPGTTGAARALMPGLLPRLPPRAPPELPPILPHARVDGQVDAQVGDSHRRGRTKPER